MPEIRMRCESMIGHGFHHTPGTRYPTFRDRTTGSSERSADTNIPQSRAFNDTGRQDESSVSYERRQAACSKACS